MLRVRHLRLIAIAVRDGDREVSRATCLRRTLTLGASHLGLSHAERGRGLFSREAHLRHHRTQPHRGVVEHRAATGRAGIVAGQRIDADAALETLRSARCSPPPARPAAGRRTRARAAPPRRARCRAAPCSPSAMPSRAASSGCISTVGRPSRFRDDGISVKLVLRKLRAGAVTRRNGALAAAVVDGCPSDPAARASWPGCRPAPPSPARNGTACPCVGKPSRKCASPNGGAASIQRSRSTVCGVRPAGRAQRGVDDLHRRHLEAADASRPAARPAPAAPRGSSGTRRAARSASDRSGCGCGRRPGTGRRAP